MVVHAGGIQGRARGRSSDAGLETEGIYLDQVTFVSFAHFNDKIMELDLLFPIHACMHEKRRQAPTSLLFTNCTAESMCQGEHLIFCYMQRHLGAGAKAPGLRAAYRHVSPEILNLPSTLGSHSLARL